MTPIPPGPSAPPGFQMGAVKRAHAWLHPEDNEQCPLGLPEAWQRMWHLRFIDCSPEPSIPSHDSCTAWGQ